MIFCKRKVRNLRYVNSSLDFVGRLRLSRLPRKYGRDSAEVSDRIRCGGDVTAHNAGFAALRRRSVTALRILQADNSRNYFVRIRR
jgi:hypothetical protein